MWSNPYRGHRLKSEYSHSVGISATVGIKSSDAVAGGVCGCERGDGGTGGGSASL